MSVELIGTIFMSIMFGHFIWNVQKWLEKKPTKTELELWTEQYEKDVPTVWNDTQ